MIESEQADLLTQRIQEHRHLRVYVRDGSGIGTGLVAIGVQLPLGRRSWATGVNLTVGAEH